MPVVHPELVKAQETARAKEKLMLETINFCFSKGTECEVDSTLHWVKIIEEMKCQWEQGIVFSHTTHV